MRLSRILDVFPYKIILACLFSLAATVPVLAQSSSADRLGLAEYGLWSGYGKPCKGFPNGFTLQVYLYRDEVSGKMGPPRAMVQYRNYTSRGQDAYFQAEPIATANDLQFRLGSAISNPSRLGKANVKISAGDTKGKLVADVSLRSCRLQIKIDRQRNEFRTRKMVAELIETTALKKQYPEYSYLSAQQLKGFGDYSGDWYGVAYCNRNPANMEMRITSLGRNRFRSNTTIEWRSTKVRTTELLRPPKSSGRFDPYDIVDLKTGKMPDSIAPLYTLDEVIKVDGRPQYIKVKLARKCNEGYLARFDKLADLSGAYGGWNTLTERCEGLTAWMKQQDKLASDASKLRASFPELLRAANFERAKGTYIYTGASFEKTFGTTLGKLPWKTAERLFEQLGECVVFREDKAPYPATNAQEYVLKPRSDRVLRSKFFPQSGGRRYRYDVPLRVSLHKLKDMETKRQKAREKLSVLQTRIAATTDQAEAVKLVGEATSDLELLPPSELAPFLTSVSKKRAVLAGAGRKGGTSPLAGRKNYVMRADRVGDHTLLAAPFGHYTYARTSEVTRATCNSQIPVRVRLYSLLPLLHLTSPRYEKPFWFYALKTLDQFCALVGAPGERRVVQVSYVFDGKVVATARARRYDRYSVKVDSVKLSVEPEIHPKDHPAYAFDKAAASMLGGVKGRFGEDIDTLALTDLEQLAKLGDLQSKTVLARSKVREKGKGKPADELIYDLSRGQSIDVARMRTASTDGSAVASYLLALDLSSKTKLFADRSQKGRDFASLPPNQQQDFIKWYAKAKVGGVFWYRYLDPVVERWNIPVAPVVAAVARSGLRGEPKAATGIAVSAADLSKGRARIALNKALTVNSCNGWETISRGRIASAAFTSWKASGEWCVMTTRVPGFTIRRMERVGSVETLDCSGGASAKSCRISFKVECRAEENSQLSLPPANVMSAVCRGIESITAVADADFTRDASAGWRIVGKVKFLPPELAGLKIKTYKDCKPDRDMAAAMRACSAIINNASRERPGVVAGAYRNRSAVFRRQKKYKEALSDLTEAIKLKPTPYAYTMRGYTHLLNGSSTRASADFEAALKMDSNYIHAHNGAGHAYKRRRQYDKAIEAYSRAIQLKPGTVNYLYNRGDAHYQSRKYDLAIADFTAALAIDPTDFNTYHMRGHAHGAKAQFDKALADFNTALKLRETPKLYGDRCNIRSRLKQHRLAIADCSKYVALAPKTASAYSTRAGAYIGAGDVHRAIADYSKALSINPKDIFDLRARARLYEKIGDKARAKADLEKAKKLEAAYEELCWMGFC